MPESFERLQKTWESLGDEDPLWAILSEPDKKAGRWQLDEFLQTGNQTVERYWQLLRRHKCPEILGQVLDFGCGVGRLTLAWTLHAQHVTGVDISQPMIEKGRQIMAEQKNVRLELNQTDNLSMFRDGQFDLVFSHIVLQHIPWKYAQTYLREFARICKPGGWVAFQLPSRSHRSQLLPRIRRWIIDHLPFGLDMAWRRWRRGSSVLFNMHFTPPSKVKALLEDAGLQEMHREFDKSAGEETEGFLYLYRKPA